MNQTRRDKLTSITKALDAALGDLNSIKDDEQEANENKVGDVDSSAYDYLESAVSNLEQIMSDIDDAMSS